MGRGCFRVLVGGYNYGRRLSGAQKAWMLCRTHGCVSPLVLEDKSGRCSALNMIFLSEILLLIITCHLSFASCPQSFTILCRVFQGNT